MNYSQQSYNANLNQQPKFSSKHISNQHQQQYSDIQQQYLKNSMSDTKPSGYYDNRTSYSKNAVLPEYGINTNGLTPMEKEQQQIRLQQENKKLSQGYPGVVGGTPAEARGIEGYDIQGNPIYPAFIAKRHQIEQSLGPTCNDGGYHDLRMLLTNSSLLYAIIIIPYCCGYRGKRVCTCTKCKEKFPNIQLPSPQ